MAHRSFPLTKKAVADVVQCSREFTQVFDAVAKAVEKGEIKESRIDIRSFFDSSKIEGICAFISKWFSKFPNSQTKEALSL